MNPRSDPALPFSITPLKLTCLAILAVFCAAMIAQSPQTQPAGAQSTRAVSLQHLYWHFLIHQSVLDAAAAKLSAEGKDGDKPRNDLQIRLGFSDADYAPIRTSSQRLASELQPVNDQIRALPRNSANAAQAKSLISQREALIANEVYNLSLELSPQNKATLEKFMAQFFAPRSLTVKPSPLASQPGKAVTVALDQGWALLSGDRRH